MRVADVGHATQLVERCAARWSNAKPAARTAVRDSTVRGGHLHAHASTIHGGTSLTAPLPITQPHGRTAPARSPVPPSTEEGPTNETVDAPAPAALQLRTVNAPRGWLAAARHADPWERAHARHLVLRGGSVPHAKEHGERKAAGARVPKLLGDSSGTPFTPRGRPWRSRQRTAGTLP